MDDATETRTTPLKAKKASKPSGRPPGVGVVNKGGTNPPPATPKPDVRPAGQAKPTADTLTFDAISEMDEDEARAACRLHNLPSDGPEIIVRRRLEALMRGGRTRYVAGLTLCPTCGHLSGQTSGQQKAGRSIVRYFVCQGPRRHRFQRAETVAG